MWNNIVYGLLYGWVYLHALLPLWVLYVLSDVLYVFVYKVARYRLRVVRSNMKGAFPQKTTQELRLLERDFYHHFTDYMVETIKLAHISSEELRRRARVTNLDLLDQLSGGARPCVLILMGHYGNWEWLASANEQLQHTQVYQIYRPLSNQAFDRLFIKLRTRFGSKGIRKNHAIREVVALERGHTRSAIVFVADQTPSKANLHYWSSFLNRETALLTGPERMARKLDLPVVFADIRKVKRGYYEVDFHLLTQTSQATPEFWITQEYTRLMERCILRNPAYWLWTHKRWKYKKEEEKR